MNHTKAPWEEEKIMSRDWIKMVRIECDRDSLFWAMKVMYELIDKTRTNRTRKSVQRVMGQER